MAEVRGVWEHLVEWGPLKALIALVGAVVLVLWGYFPLTPAAGLLGLIVLDFLLGFTYALRTRTFSQQKMKAGGVKIVLYSIAILIVVALEAVTDGTAFIGPISQWWAEWAVIYLALTEATSALSHVAKWAELSGMNFPGLAAIHRLVDYGKREMDKKVG